jgi:hypothetical protein
MSWCAAHNRAKFANSVGPSSLKSTLQWSSSSPWRLPQPGTTQVRSRTKRAVVIRCAMARDVPVTVLMSTDAVNLTEFVALGGPSAQGTGVDDHDGPVMGR